MWRVIKHLVQEWYTFLDPLKIKTHTYKSNVCDRITKLSKKMYKKVTHYPFHQLRVITQKI